MDEYNAGDSTKPLGISVGERLLHLERDTREQARSLREGAKTFEEIRNGLEAVKDGNRITPAKAAAIICAILAAIIGPFAAITWQASRYPDRLEFKQLEKDVLQLRYDIVRIESAVSNCRPNSGG